MLVDEVQQGGSIDRSEGELLRNAIGFSEQQAKDILIHRVDLAALPVTAMILHGQSAKNSSISEVMTLPRAFAASRCGSNGMSPGVRKMMS